MLLADRFIAGLKIIFVRRIGDYIRDCRARGEHGFIFGLKIALVGVLKVINGIRIKYINRVRGSGWLDCPNCHEHASQDVVDEMVFFAFFWGVYRLTPIGRRRVLLCPRCGFRRAATPPEMAALDTAGEPISRAWMLPMGGLGLAVVSGLIWVFIASSQSTVVAGLTFSTHSGGQVAPGMTLDSPGDWNFNLYPKPSGRPPFIHASDTSGNNYSMDLVRDAKNSSLPSLLAAAFADQKSNIQSSGLPSAPPPGQCVKVGDQTGYTISMPLQRSGVDSVVIIYVFTHDGVGYTLTFGADGADGIKAIKEIADHVAKSVKFSGHESPAPSPTPSPTAVATPTPTTTANPAGQPSPTPSPTPGLPDISCGS